MAETVARPLGLLIHAWVLAFVGVIVALSAGHVIFQYESLFKGFGAELSASTRFVLASTWLWRLMGVCALALGVWVMVKSELTRARLRTMKLAVRAFTGVFGSFAAFSIYALYVPIFALGAVV
jgi:type II secretory pathway component PulF